MILEKLEQLKKEISLYFKDLELDKDKTIVNVKNLLSWKNATEEERENIKESLISILKNKGYERGFKFYLDLESMEIKIKDIHIAEVKVFNKNNRPKAIVTFIEDVKEVVIGFKTFKKNKIYNNDRTIAKETPISLILPAVELDNAFYKAEYRIDEEYIKTNSYLFTFTKDSIIDFYRFKNTSFVNFTNPIVNKYWNYDCPNLIHYTTNINSNCNGWGLHFLLWQDTIVELDWGTAYISEDITENEVNWLTKNHEDTWVSKDIKRKYISMNNKDEEDMQNKKEKISNIINNIQNVINNNAEDILDEAIFILGYHHSSTLYSNDVKKRIQQKCNFLSSKENSMGLDCGFLYFRFKDENLNELTKEVAIYGLSSCNEDGTFTLNIPFDQQSTTIKKHQAKKICDLLKNSGIAEITFRTVLD